MPSSKSVIKILSVFKADGVRTKKNNSPVITPAFLWVFIAEVWGEFVVYGIESTIDPDCLLDESHEVSLDTIIDKKPCRARFECSCGQTFEATHVLDGFEMKKF